MPPTDDPSAREELASLVGALRSWVELHHAAGTTGLERSDDELVSARIDTREDDVRTVEDVDSTAALAAPDEPVNPAPATLAAAPDANPIPHRLTLAEGARLVPDDRTRRLEVLRTEVAACTGCRLHETRTQTVFSRGNGSSGVCFVGEGPGADEDAQGYPFVGAAGQLLDRMITAMGLERDEVWVGNVVKCRPPKNRKPEADEMAACLPYLDEQLALVQPKVLVLLGATALEGLLGIKGGITRLRGKWRLYKGEIPVMPTFHPAYLLRTPGAKRDVWADLQEVLRHLGRPVPEKSAREKP